MSLPQTCLAEGRLAVLRLRRGHAWLDTGKFAPMPTQRQGMQIGCPQEIAFQKGWIGAETLAEPARALSRTGYGRHLTALGPA